MADVRRVQDLTRDADEALWPIRSEKLDAMQEWLTQARALLARRPRHVARLIELAQALSSPDPEADIPSLEWQRATLASLITSLGALEGEDRLGATIASIEWRIERAHRIRAQSLDAHRDAWQRATASISDRELCPVYGGLVLHPQLGLVPLGRNERSGLWEFWHTPSGSRPAWSSDGSCRLERASGLVFVLVPGGEFRMGAERPPGGRGYGPNLDRHSGHVSRPVHALALDAFFVSRFEFTQGQWAAWTGSNPARLQAPTTVRGRATTWTNPFERVTWREATRVLRQLGLVLPTKALWEYACRAGTRTVFEPGNALATVRGFENLADEASRAHIAGNWSCDAGVDDGYALHAPVGSFRASRWSIYDMHGNVAEWCRDRFGDYKAPVARGDGLRLTPPERVPGYVVRGGSFYWPAVNARAADRHRYGPDARMGFVGFRAARAIEAR